MPAVYAHRRFGEKVLAACQNDVARTAIESYPDQIGRASCRERV